MKECLDSTTKGKLPTGKMTSRRNGQKQLSNIQAEKTSNLHETQVDTENMTPTDTKERLKEMGVTTRARNLKKL